MSSFSAAAVRFQVVPPCGGHLPTVMTLLGKKLFQVVPPCGGHLSLGPFPEFINVVSSRAPVWGASPARKSMSCATNVSSRAPVWGASTRSFSPLREKKFQVVPPCGGHHLFAPLSSLQWVVSSRAPVWGASHAAARVPKFSLVSSRAPVWGASWLVKHQEMLFPKVSSRAPVWGASFVAVIKPLNHIYVSSRAPVWGASRHTRSQPPRKGSFKSCPRVGGIKRQFGNFSAFVVSSRAPVWGASAAIMYFTSRASFVSSRAPVWGASATSLPVPTESVGFKSCPRVGGIFKAQIVADRAAGFQVVPPCGGHLSAPN